MVNQFPPVTLQDMQLTAERRGGKCLSIQYIDSSTHLLWECAKGHQWKAIPNNIRRGRWCPYCSTRPPKTIDDMCLIATKNGGKCLSDVYLNARSILKWQCSEGHIWKSTYANIQSGHWCPQCAYIKFGLSNRKWNIKKLQAFASQKGGKCISMEYINYNHKLKWQCFRNHIWRASTANVIKGTWCPECAIKQNGISNRKYTIGDMLNLAVKHNGKCLSNVYLGVKHKLKWRCQKKHTWKSTPDSILCGTWCPYCGHSVKLRLSYIRKIAQKRGGKCLSNEYKNSDSPLTWECRKGHIWRSTAHSIIFQGTWCPICSAGLGERICREVLELLLKNEFPKSRPAWLLNNQNQRMELDGYCEKLKLAFEYHGRQHYEVGHFSYNKQELLKRQQSDNLKRELCRLRGINLIEIPYTIPYQKIPLYLINFCKQNDYKILDNQQPIDIAKLNIYEDKNIERMQALAEKNRGVCLSEIYINASTNLLWQCSESHIWEANPNTIQQGKWCKICSAKRGGAKRRADTLLKFKALAESLGGKCISDEFVNYKSLMIWGCASGHQWQTSANNIKQGFWCRLCKNKPIQDKKFHELKKLALMRGGICLSKSYIGTHSKMKWRCSKGHLWETTPRIIKQGHWCIKCAWQRKSKSPNNLFPSVA